MFYGQHVLHSLDDLERLIPSMHSAERRRIHIEGMSDEEISLKFNPDIDDYVTVYPDGYWEKNLNAVVNTTTNRAVQGTGGLYQVLQHKDFFCAVCDLLRQKGFEQVEGYAIEANGGNRWHVRVTFPGVTIYEPGLGKNINVGGEFSNSYDSFYAARGRAYYMRHSCYNQMILSNAIPKCTFTRNHIADTPSDLLEIVTDKAELFVRNLVKSGADFKRIMGKAIKTELEFEKYVQLENMLKDVFKVQAHAESIAELAWQNFAARDMPGAAYQITLWDIYNSATYYSSHENLTPQVQDAILYRAEQKILKGKVEVPPVEITA